VAHRFESEVVDPDDYNTSLDPDVKQDYLNCLFHRMPTLPRDGEIVGFSSMYTVNTPSKAWPVRPASAAPSGWLAAAAEVWGSLSHDGASLALRGASREPRLPKPVPPCVR